MTKEWQTKYLAKRGAKWHVEIPELEEEAADFATKVDALRYLGRLLEGISPPRAGRQWRYRIVTTGGRRSASCPTLAAAVRARRADLAVLSEQKALPRSARPECDETLGAACVRVVQMQRAAGLASWKDRLSRLQKYVIPGLGKMQPHRVTARVLEDVCAAVMRKHGRSRQTAVHVRDDVYSVFRQLLRDRLIDVNPALKLELPKSTAIRKERATVTDEELVQYLAYVHPQKEHQKEIRETQTMAVVARCFGGLRTGDLHALRWEHFAPDFSWGWAPRKKTRAPQRMAVPEVLRPYLAAWHAEHGSPATGLLFPCRKRSWRKRGEDRRGQDKIKVSHARAFRRDLKRALGLETWNASKRKYEAADREMTPREVELFVETEYTLPVDFHSWRRAYAQALAAAGVNEQQAMALTGHTSATVHHRYSQSAAKVATVPASALPRLGVPVSTAPAPVSTPCCRPN